jgi:ABC-type oligopeptide transport system substrate-binding subunit
MPIYSPLREDMVAKSPDNWTQSGDTYIGNGPFQMVKWTHNDSMDLEKERIITGMLAK